MAGRENNTQGIRFMTPIRFRPAWVPLFGLVLATWSTAAVEAQQEPAPAPPPSRDSISEQLRPYDEPGYPLPPIRSQSEAPQQRRSVVHHYPYPYPGAYHGDETGGFRNPGGVGRYAEYYPPGNRLQQNNDPVRRARFDQGGGAPDRQEQIQAYNAGTARYNAIQQHIDRYGAGRMYYGFGFGMGGFGGFW